MDTIKTERLYQESEQQCEVLSMMQAVINGLDMVHCRYALGWDEDEKGWYVEIPIAKEIKPK